MKALTANLPNLGQFWIVELPYQHLSRSSVNFNTTQESKARKEIYRVTVTFLPKFKLKKEIDKWLALYIFSCHMKAAQGERSHLV